MSLLNIDIINKKVANDTGISEKTVGLINSFYWLQASEHIRLLNLQPLNFMNIGYVRHSNLLIRLKILKTVAKLRKLKDNKKYKPDGVKKLAIEQKYRSQLRQLWGVRNIKTFTLDDE